MQMPHCVMPLYSCAPKSKAPHCDALWPRCLMPRVVPRSQKTSYGLAYTCVLMGCPCPLGLVPVPCRVPCVAPLSPWCPYMCCPCVVYSCSIWEAPFPFSPCQSPCATSLFFLFVPSSKANPFGSLSHSVPYVIARV
jgi:hypothetical protein